MADRVLNATEYAEYLGMCVQTFSTIRHKCPQDFAPSFRIGRHERWFESTIQAFHHSQETTAVGSENNKSKEK